MSEVKTFDTQQKRSAAQRRRLFIILIAGLIIVLIGSSLAAYFTFFLGRGSPAAIPMVGHAFFVSSGLLSTSPESSQGITDQLQINLQGIPDPQPGKSYYAWLLNEKNLEWKPIFLGKLPLNHGTVDFSYPGDSDHTDLLASNSRLLITEEDADVPPNTPSLDSKTWRYYAQISQIAHSLGPNAPKYSLYDHIRHLLAEDPTLKAVGLTGGLDIWLYRNTQKILEWSGSARDSWQTKSTGSGQFIRRQLTRILDYLDGVVYVQQDLPGQPLLVDPTIAKVALLTFDIQRQNPPGYLYHIGSKHLHEITQLPEATDGQRALAVQINVAVNNVDFWLHIVRTDAVKLYTMSDDQLFGDDGRTLLDDLAAQANNAFVGQINPRSNQVKEGVVQIHYNIQRLATFDIRECTSSHPCPL